jgi:ribonucleoside-triphosphate reductase (thioredoxin)
MRNFEMTPVGSSVYRRTYARDRESWPDTVARVVDGNIALAASSAIGSERDALYDYILNGRIIPAGRHLYMTGVEGRQFLNNCHVSGWTERMSDHFQFTFMRLMEGGGVGANYSKRERDGYTVRNIVRVNLFCSPEHPDFTSLSGVESSEYSPATTKAIDDSREGWAEALTDIIDAGTGAATDGRFTVAEDEYATIVYINFDLSNIRPSGSAIKTFGGTAAGPGPLATLLLKTVEILNSMWLDGDSFFYMMALDHAISECVVSGNVRRSARMSIMHWQDPEILEFISLKETSGSHWSTNISVEIDARFVALIGTGDINMELPTHEYLDSERQRAVRVYMAICNGMLMNGEPGFWDSSLANEDEVERVIATNPCGEIGLAAWENCCLGHVNLAAFVDDGRVDLRGLRTAHWLMTRFLIRSTYGDTSDPKQAKIVAKNRRIGVGHLGYQWFCNSLGIRYSESHSDLSIQKILQGMYAVVRDTANSYAFNLRIPSPIKVTTVAPTGTIAKLFGVSEGIQPIYGRFFIRRIRFSTIDPGQVAQTEEFREKGYNIVSDPDTANTVIVEIPTEDTIMAGVPARYRHLIEDASEVPIVDALRVQEMYQRLWADNSVSYTVNIPESEVSSLKKELPEMLEEFLGFIKGTTLMVDGSRPLSPYERISEDDYYELIEFMESETGSAGDGGCASGACPVR